GSRTAPVMELIDDGQNGLLADFFSPEEFADKAIKVLENPGDFRPLGRAAEKLIEEKYSLEAVTPMMLKMYEDAANTRTGLESPHPPAPVVPRQAIQRARPQPAMQTTIKKSTSPFRG